MAKVYEKTNLGKDKNISYDEEYKLDKTDKKILKMLHDNARQSLADMSRESGLTRDVIRYRIEKLVENKVILGFRPMFNPPALGMDVVNHVYFLLNPQTLDQEKKFVQYLKGHPRVISVNSLVGRWEYRVTIIGEDQGDFNATLKEIRIKFPNLVRDFETMSMLEEYKHDDYSGLF